MYVTKSSCSASTTTTQTHLLHTPKTWKCAACFCCLSEQTEQTHKTGCTSFRREPLTCCLPTAEVNKVGPEERAEPAWEAVTDLLRFVRTANKSEEFLCFSFVFSLIGAAPPDQATPSHRKGVSTTVRTAVLAGFVFFSITVFVNNFVRIGSRLEF